MRLLKSIALYFLVFFSGCGGIELFLRVTDLCPVNIYQPHPVLGPMLAPDRTFRKAREATALYRTNSLGFVDREHESTPPPGTRRILFLGNSYVEATQVQLSQRFSSLVEDQLNAHDSNSPSGREKKIKNQAPAHERKGRTIFAENDYAHSESPGRAPLPPANSKDVPAKWETMNMGVAATDTGISYLIFKEYGRRFRPDLVVLGTNVTDLDGNLHNPRKPGFFIDEKGELGIDYSFTESWSYQFARYIAPVKVRSALVSYLGQTIRVLESEPLLPVVLGKFVSLSGAGQEGHRKGKNVSADGNGLKIYETVLRRLTEEISLERGKLVALFFPIPVAISAPESSSEPGVATFHRVRKEMLGVLAKLEIPVIDLTLPLRRHYQKTGENVSWWPKSSQYGHINATGHQIVADLVRDYVQTSFH